jgi:ubiquinone biosynthesis protein UbiJ
MVIPVAKFADLHDKIKQLEAENARLKAEVERLTEAWVDKKMQEDRDALLEQVERLTKAGDMTAGRLERFCKDWGFSDEETKDQIEEWNATKEGKQP